LEREIQDYDQNEPYQYDIIAPYSPGKKLQKLNPNFQISTLEEENHELKMLNNTESKGQRDAQKQIDILNLKLQNSESVIEKLQDKGRHDVEFYEHRMGKLCRLITNEVEKGEISRELVVKINREVIDYHPEPIDVSCLMEFDRSPCGVVICPESVYKGVVCDSDIIGAEREKILGLEEQVHAMKILVSRLEEENRRKDLDHMRTQESCDGYRCRIRDLEDMNYGGDPWQPCEGERGRSRSRSRFCSQTKKREGNDELKVDVNTLHRLLNEDETQDGGQEQETTSFHRRQPKSLLSDQKHTSLTPPKTVNLQVENEFKPHQATCEATPDNFCATPDDFCATPVCHDLEPHHALHHNGHHAPHHNHALHHNGHHAPHHNHYTEGRYPKIPNLPLHEKTPPYTTGDCNKDAMGMPLRDIESISKRVHNEPWSNGKHATNDSSPPRRYKPAGRAVNILTWDAPYQGNCSNFLQKIETRGNFSNRYDMNKLQGYETPNAIPYQDESLNMHKPQPHLQL
jgi:hypothetical protein